MMGPGGSPAAKPKPAAPAPAPAAAKKPAAAPASATAPVAAEMEKLLADMLKGGAAPAPAPAPAMAPEQLQSILASMLKPHAQGAVQPPQQQQPQQQPQQQAAKPVEADRKLPPPAPQPQPQPTAPLAPPGLSTTLAPAKRAAAAATAGTTAPPAAPPGLMNGTEELLHGRLSSILSSYSPFGGAAPGVCAGAIEEKPQAPPPLPPHPQPPAAASLLPPGLGISLGTSLGGGSAHGPPASLATPPLAPMPTLPPAPGAKPPLFDKAIGSRSPGLPSPARSVHNQLGGGTAAGGNGLTTMGASSSLLYVCTVCFDGVCCISFCGSRLTNPDQRNTRGSEEGGGGDSSHNSALSTPKGSNTGSLDVSVASGPLADLASLSLGASCVFWGAGPACCGRLTGPWRDNKHTTGDVASSAEAQDLAMYVLGVYACMHAHIHARREIEKGAQPQSQPSSIYTRERSQLQQVASEKREALEAKRREERVLRCVLGSMYEWMDGWTCYLPLLSDRDCLKRAAACTPNQPGTSRRASACRRWRCSAGGPRSTTWRSRSAR